MVIGSENYPPNGLKQHGYAHVEEYYQNPQKRYAQMEDYYAQDDCYNSSSSNINMRANPYMISPQPIKHGLVGQESYGHQDNHYGQAQMHMSHDIHGYGKHSNGMNYGQEGYYTQPHTGQANGKKMNGMYHNGSYETEHESYTQMGPNRYESASYDYHGESPNYGHKNKKNWAAAGAEWIAKGL